MSKWNSPDGYGWKLGGGYMFIGTAIGGLGLLPEGSSILPVLVLGFVLGLGNGVFMVTFHYCLQKETPPHMIGRVFGIQSTVLGFVMIAAPLLGGAMVQIAGPARIFLDLGIVIAALGLIGLLFRSVFWPKPKI
ncbi:Major Facilitator Superfamily protein [compost metagenome]